MTQKPSARADIHRILKGTSPEIRGMLLLAHEQKFAVRPTSGGHYGVSTPLGVRPMKTVFMSKTPSDMRGLHRMRAKLRRIGVNIPR